MIRQLLISILVFMLPVFGSSQNRGIKVEAANQPLNRVLLQLREQYDFQFSYSDTELSQYTVTVSKTFFSKEETLRFLFDGLPFQVKKTGEVFIIIPEKKGLKEAPKKGHTHITGQIIEAGSSEPLPYSQILINNHPLFADVTGNFNFSASADSTFHVRISHLGYYIFDTLVYAGFSKKFRLIPATLTLPEVLVRNNDVERATMVGEKPGKITINSNIARFLPGQGDNSVFNQIRLMPGIQAAGEQSNDVLIWGSYEGQSLITFDGFTLFGLKNYNDNISVVNPFLVKNIEILKGGFEAKYGDRVGGIVNITGKNGNTKKPVFSLNINPTTINAMAEIPLFKKSSLLVAYRQTYYNLYNSGDFNIFAPTRSLPKNHGNSVNHHSIAFDMEVFPNDYQFRDLNLKYSFNLNNGDQFYVSLYGGGDHFSMDAAANIVREMNGKSMMMNPTPLTVSLLNKEENWQLGFSAFYHKKWSDRLLTKFVVSHSDFSKTSSDSVQSVNSTTYNLYSNERMRTRNTASENSLRIENILNFLNGHQLEFGGGFYSNEAKIDLSGNLTGNLPINTLDQYLNQRGYAYVQDYLPLGDRLILKSGARINRITGKNQMMFEPRLSATYKLAENLKISASWGQYHQFIFKVPTIDMGQNYTYLWITGNQNIPVLKAAQWVSEINYSENNLTINLQAYYKPIGNMTERVYEQRVVKGHNLSGYYPYFGDAKSFGIDLLAKKDFGKHSVWASYTLSKSLERFAPQNQSLPDYSLAPQDQRHELKVAGLFNIGHFYLSANYVYGSGLAILKKVFPDATNVAYNRADASATYKFTHKQINGELGLSVLNVFDTQNLRYANLKIFRLTSDLGDFRVYSSSVPFTPVLFLKMVF